MGLHPGSLGNERKVMSQISYGMSQRDHRCIIFCELVETPDDPKALLQPFGHRLDNVALSISQYCSRWAEHPTSASNIVIGNCFASLDESRLSSRRIGV